ncbi:trace amine-associated receptor 5-like [Oculina patagonica]
MFSNKTELAADDSDQTRAVFSCPTEPTFTWILSDTSTFQAAIITSCIASPIVILLNIIIIIAVKARRELQTNSNILLASLALADCFVGAVSMPLSISLDALLLHKTVGYFICRIAFANQLVLYAAVCSSLYHLTVVAWERYVAIRKWNYYKVKVTRKRVKMYAGIAWLLAVLTTTPVRILTALGVDYKFIKILDLIFTLPAVVCIILIGYFYIMVYLGARKRRVNDRSQPQGLALTVAQREHGICKKMFIQTVALLIFFVPSCTVLFLGEVLPFLRTSSFFRKSELLIQLNSLVNPFLYFFSLRRFRKAVLEMLKFRKPEMELAAGVKRRRRVKRFNDSENLEDVLECEQGSGLCDSIMFSDAVNVKPFEPVMERSASTSSCEGSHSLTIRVDVHQPRPKKRKPKLHFDRVITKEIHPETTAEPQSSRRRVMTRSQSYDENASVDVICKLGRLEADERRRRSNTTPSSRGSIEPSEDVFKRLQASCLDI